MLAQCRANYAINLIDFIYVSEILLMLAQYCGKGVLSLKNKQNYFTFIIMLAQRCENAQHIQICMMLGQRWANIDNLILLNWKNEPYNPCIDGYKVL